MVREAPPYFRVTTFGRFALERLVSGANEDEPRYEAITERQWRGRSAARSLLKLLLCRTRRRAPRDVLSETFWPDSDYNAEHCLDSALSVLRTLLRPTPKGDSLLATITAGDTIIYELPPQQQIWTDFDACNMLLNEAERSESQGHDPLPLLEQAQQLIQGEFLEEERYSDWAQLRRDGVNATRRRLLHRLVNLYMQRNNIGQAEALLFTTLEYEPTDEDALCRLLLLLYQQGRRHEALRLYEYKANILREEYATEPSAYTQELVKHLRNETSYLEPTLFAPYGWLHEALTPTSAQSLLAHQQQKGGSAGERQGNAPMTHQHPNFSDGVLHSRRQIITALVGFAGTSLLGIPIHRTSEAALEAYLIQSSAMLEQSWHALQGNGLAAVAQTLPQHISTLQTIVQQSAIHRKTAACLLSSAYQLAGIIAWHKNDLSSREQYNRIAVFYARLGEDDNILVAALMCLACTYHAARKPMKALQVYEDALRYQKNIYPFFTGRLYAGLASAHAQCRHQQIADRYLHLLHAIPTATMTDIPSSIYADFSLPLVILYEGQAYRYLNQPENAWNAYAQLETQRAAILVPERIRLEVVNHRAEAALLLNDQERFYDTLQEGITGAKTIQSVRRGQEVVDLYNVAQGRWMGDVRVRDLEELLHS